MPLTCLVLWMYVWQSLIRSFVATSPAQAQVRDPFSLFK